MSTTATVLVTGAGGKTGRRIVDQLTEKRHSVISAGRSDQGKYDVRFDDVARIISETAGRTITHCKLSMTELMKSYERQGLPPEYATTLAAMDVNIAKGSEAQLTTIFQKITGKRPVDFESFAKNTVDSWITN